MFVRRLQKLKYLRKIILLQASKKTKKKIAKNVMHCPNCQYVSDRSGNMTRHIQAKHEPRGTADQQILDRMARIERKCISVSVVKTYIRAF